MAAKKVDPKQNFPKLETEILKFWDDNNIFEKSVAQRPAGKVFSFYDGPPFATGLPHYGHLLAGTIKDVIPRYKTMQGYRVERIWGWDTHGLPIENIVEQELDIKTKDQVQELGIDKFNELCRTKVFTYAEEWKKIVGRTGRWADMESAYLTMNPEFMESVWWAFSELHKKGLAYEGHKVMPYCPRCATPLSNMEVGQGYKDKRDKAVTVKFELVDEPGTYFLAWTTTPWTLPGNLALSVGPKIEYSTVATPTGNYILATERIESYAEQLGKYTIRDTFLGHDLVGKKYRPVFDCYAEVTKAFQIIDGNHVTTEDGTGIVHTAPAFGEADYAVAKEHGIDFFMPVDDLGNFTIEVADYAGQSVISLETNENIIRDLGDKAFRVEGITHSYPHCWRCDTPLIYKGVSSWFVAVEKLKQKMLANNKEIYWLPDSIGHGRFQKLIENAPDWSISRNRFWGTPLPIWRCNKCEKIEVVGSIAELADKSKSEVTDIHLHKINYLNWACDCGGKMEISGEVFDCWFESGSMPFASIHYPFENNDKFERDFPADFIAEGIDQTRGWFYSLLVLSTALFDKSSYQSVIVNGTILAESGQKMSKKLRNYPDPMEIVDKYGADAMRFYLMGSPAVHADDFRFAEKGVEEVVKKVILTLWNSYSFYVTYSEIDGFVPTGKLDLKHPMDFWIVSELNQLIADITESFDGYDLAKVVRKLSDFVDDLSNWYIRRSRRRFWKSENDSDKNAAYETLYHVLTTYVKLLSPFMPFVSDEIYRNLMSAAKDKAPESVHLCDWPKADKKHVNLTINAEMHLARTAVEKGLRLRAQVGINVRQPLSVAYIYDVQALALSIETKTAITEELNVHNLVVNPEQSVAGIAYENTILLNFREAGPVLGSRLREVKDLLAAGKYQLHGCGKVQVGDIELESNLTALSYKASADKPFVMDGDGQVVVFINTEIEDELLTEGLVRELVRKIQDARKKANLQVNDRILLSVISKEFQSILSGKWLEYVKKETLATELLFVSQANSGYNEEVLIGEHKLTLELSKV